MKKLAFALLVAASVSNAYAWVCTAQSPSAVGQGISPFLNVAQERAMYECMIRTPGWQACYIVSCY